MIGSSTWNPALARALAALLVALGGVVHLDLWLGGYRGIPTIGPLFLTNVIVSGVVAVLLVLDGGRATVVAGMLIATAALGGLALSRSVGLFGFMETTWTPAAARAVAAELGATVSLALMATVGARSPGCRGVELWVAVWKRSVGR